MAEYIKRKVLVDLVLSKLHYLGDARIMNENDEKVLSEIDGYEKAIEDIHELILDKDLIEDVQPVKHGQWNEIYHDNKNYSASCTCCQEPTVRRVWFRPYDFCPHCGARMDGDSE